MRAWLRIDSALRKLSDPELDLAGIPRLIGIVADGVDPFPDAASAPHRFREAFLDSWGVEAA